MRQAYRVINELDGVYEVQTFGDLLHIFVDDATMRSQPVEEALKESGMDVEGMRVTGPRMEEAFISLVRRQKGTAED